MSIRDKVAAVIVLCALSFASGRWLTPVKVKIETKTVEVERIHEDRLELSKILASLDIEKKETIAKDGSRVIETHAHEESEKLSTLDNKKTDVIEKASDTTKEVTRSASRTSVSALVEVIPLSGIAYGVSVTRDILGPISVGVWGLASGQGGISVGLSL